MSEIKTVGVVGTGVIGASWTALFLSRGKHVLVADPAPNAADTLKAHLESFWPVVEEIGLAPGANLQNYRFAGASLGEHYGEVDYVQENAPERLELKKKLITEIDSKTRPEIVIASSSSGIPSSQFVTGCKHPERVLIGHPFHPPHIMPLVEVVGHPGSSKEAIATAMKFYTSVDKRPVHVMKETPGHAANRIQAAVMNEAFSLVSHGVLTATDVDALVTTSLGPRYALMGPFLSNVSGGGGGPDGFRHLLEHLGPAVQGWLKDMKDKQISYDAETYDKLSQSVRKEQDIFDIKEVEKQRDELLVRLLKDKKTASAIV
ncbi:hypothetical protein PRZ48_014138 [Zasmidium cellare]|uniref:3-hydroxyacyl-CoA dehydrogenase n=1 Tax=Zasmidium cellare TaxID=395010 RepID=A0ABR0E042_ZASCE|nr:hypothetical protein PRZ48_014138 [Zasmidium cellare]